ncbi:hypothetical protein [Marinicella sp. W31]|uniref:hypothetical protein n=1 Tax=Marinicella sp. W31 TaxID=3023713 RepID=UPI003757A558
MKVVPHKSSGFNAKTVCEILEVSKQTLRYWVGVLYPLGRCRHYNSFEVLLLRIVKEFVLWNDVKVKGFDWEDFTEKLSKIPIYDLTRYHFYMNTITNDLLVYSDDDEPKITDRGKHKTAMNLIVQEHINSLLLFGVGNRAA